MSEKETDNGISIVNVYRSFGAGDRTVRVLRGVDLEAHAGEMIGLYGPSGSGKTTLLNLIGALDMPDDGQIYINGTDITRLREGKRSRLRREQMGFIFQNYTLLPTYTALENIDLALRLPGLGFFERRKRSKAALQAIGLSAWASHMPDELSGGQKQRIAIARALAARPAIVLADEPTSEVDTATSKRIMTFFQAFAREQGTIFLIVSHDPIVVEYVDKAYDLVDGQVVAHKKDEEIADEDA